MLDHAMLYFIPNQGRDDIAEGGEFLKIQPGTGDNLSLEDIAEGYTDYVIWNRFRPEYLDIDGELDMECLDSGMLLIKEIPGQARDDKEQTCKNILADVIEQAYSNKSTTMQLMEELSLL